MSRINRNFTSSSLSGGSESKGLQSGTDRSEGNGDHHTSFFFSSVDANSSLTLVNTVPRQGSAAHLFRSGNDVDASLHHNSLRNTGRHTARSVPTVSSSSSSLLPITKESNHDTALLTPDRALLIHLRLEKKLLEMEKEFLHQTLSSIPETVAFKVSTVRASAEAEERLLLARYLQALQTYQLEKKNAENTKKNDKTNKKSKASSSVCDGKKAVEKKVLGAVRGVGGTPTTVTTRSGRHKEEDNLTKGKRVSADKKSKVSSNTPTQKEVPIASSAAEDSLRRLEEEMREHAKQAQIRKEELDRILVELKGTVTAFFSPFLSQG